MRALVYLFLLWPVLVQMVGSQDTISTIAGTGTTSYNGDNGAASSATLNYPYGVALDSTGIQSLS